MKTVRLVGNLAGGDVTTRQLDRDRDGHALDPVDSPSRLDVTPMSRYY